MEIAVGAFASRAHAVGESEEADIVDSKMNAINIKRGVGGVALRGDGRVQGTSGKQRSRNPE